MKELKIIIGGIGGQGDMLLERIIGASSTREGHSARAADTIGGAQRCGLILSHFRLGSNVNSSLVSQGKGHVILGLELGEALGIPQFLKR